MSRRKEKGRRKTGRSSICAMNFRMADLSWLDLLHGKVLSPTQAMRRFSIAYKVVVLWIVLLCIHVTKPFPPSCGGRHYICGAMMKDAIYITQGCRRPARRQ